MDESRLQLPKPEVEHLYYVEVDIETMLPVGKLPEGTYRIIPITGGRFQGERMKGTIRRIGADWNTTRGKGTVYSHVTTRYVLETDDGVTISLFTDGRARYGLDAMVGMIKRNPDPNKIYFRQHLFFRTGDERYAWLNDRICFAVVCLNKNMKVCYDAYMLK
jgi:Protein of unknown function (DUF3237)